MVSDYKKKKKEQTQIGSFQGWCWAILKNQGVFDEKCIVIFSKRGNHVLSKFKIAYYKGSKANKDVSVMQVDIGAYISVQKYISGNKGRVS